MWRCCGERLVRIRNILFWVEAMIRRPLSSQATVTWPASVFVLCYANPVQTGTFFLSDSEDDRKQPDVVLMRLMRPRWFCSGPDSTHSDINHSGTWRSSSPPPRVVSDDFVIQKPATQSETWLLRCFALIGRYWRVNDHICNCKWLFLMCVYKVCIMCVYNVCVCWCLTVLCFIKVTLTKRFICFLWPEILKSDSLPLRAFCPSWIQ